MKYKEAVIYVIVHTFNWFTKHLIPFIKTANDILAKCFLQQDSSKPSGEAMSGDSGTRDIEQV